MLEVRNISKRFGSTVVLHDVSIKIETGKILSLAGESGCGKSTLLRIIAGLEKADSGAVFFEGIDMSSSYPEKRKCGFVFQHPALFPHLNVAKNVMFGVRKKLRTTSKLNDLLIMTGMSGLDDKYPHQLSGGQQQRVALARALAIDPQILILDEPFSSLDELIKAKIRDEIFGLLKELEVTTIMVSHQATDSFLIADKLTVMKKGQIIQEGTPTEIYQYPGTPYTADLLGNSVFLNGKAVSGKVETAFGILNLPHVPPSFSLLIRSENVEITNKGNCNIKGKMKRKLFKGRHDILVIQSHTSDETFLLEASRCAHSVGEDIYLRFPEEHVMIVNQQAVSVHPARQEMN